VASQAALKRWCFTASGKVCVGAVIICRWARLSCWPPFPASCTPRCLSARPRVRCLCPPGKTQHLLLKSVSQCSTDPGPIAGTWHRPLFLTRDRWFESGSLQRRVQCEPDFRGRIPSMTVEISPTSDSCCLVGVKLAGPRPSIIPCCFTSNRRISHPKACGPMHHV
jgi:hypothetical protein